MADEGDDILSVIVKVDVNEADREYDAWQKRRESMPLRIPVELVYPTEAGARTARTFGGGTALGGTVEATSSAAPVAGLQAQQQAALVQRLAGGAPLEGGLAPGVGPVPTASTNSVYGSVGYNRVSSPFGTIQQLPSSPQPSQLAVSQSQAAYNGYSPPLITPPPPSRSLVLRQATDLARPRFSGSGTPDDPIRLEVRRSPLITPIDYARQTRLLEGPPPTPYEIPLDEDGRFATQTTGTSSRRPRQGPFRSLSEFVASRNRRDDPIVEENSLAGATGGRRSNPLFRGSLTRYLGIYEAARATESFFQGQTDFQQSLIDNANDPIALAQAKANDPTRRFVQGIPILGGIASSVADFATGASVGASRTLAASQIQDQNTALAVQRSINLNDARGGLRVANASLAGGAFGAIAANAEQARQLNDQVRLRTEIAAAEKPFTDRQQGLNDRVNAADENVFGRARRGENFSKADVAEFNDALSARAENKRQRDEAGEGVRQLNQIGLATNAADNASLRQNAQIQTRIVADQTRLSLRADRIAATGNVFGAQQASVQAAFEPQFNAAQDALVRARVGYTAGQNPAADAEVQRLQGVVTSIAAQQQIATRQGAIGLRQAQIGLSGNLAAGNLALGFHPLAATLSANQTAFQQAIVTGENTTAAPNSIQYQSAQQNRDLANRQAIQQNTLARISIGNSLNAESRSLARSEARDPVGAEAQGEVGDAINRVQSLAQRGFGDLAERARANSIKRLDVLRDDYKFSFTGSEEDAQNNVIFNSRNSQDPSEVFGQIRDAQDRVRNADANAGRDDGGDDTSGKVGITDDGLNKIADGVTKGLKALLTN